MQSPLSDQDVDRIAAAVSARIESDRVKRAREQSDMAQILWAENLLRESTERADEKARNDALVLEECKRVLPWLRFFAVLAGMLAVYSLMAAIALARGLHTRVPFSWLMQLDGWWLLAGTSAVVTCIIYMFQDGVRKKIEEGEEAPAPSETIKPV